MSDIGATGELRCSFCQKAQRRVRKVIAGPRIYICNECVELCNEILEEEHITERRWTVGDLLLHLDRFEAEELQRDMSPADARVYSDAATRFVRWLNREPDGDQSRSR